jgi:hypothetical protein
VNLLLKLTALDSRWEVFYYGHGSSGPMLEQCCVSVIFIPDPTTTKEEGEKFVVLPFLCHKFHKIENYFSYSFRKNELIDKAL